VSRVLGRVNSGKRKATVWCLTVCLSSFFFLTLMPYAASVRLFLFFPRADALFKYRFMHYASSIFLVQGLF